MLTQVVGAQIVMINCHLMLIIFLLVTMTLLDYGYKKVPRDVVSGACHGSVEMGFSGVMNTSVGHKGT